MMNALIKRVLRAPWSLVGAGARPCRKLISVFLKRVIQDRIKDEVDDFVGVGVFQVGQTWFMKRLTASLSLLSRAAWREFQGFAPPFTKGP